MNYNYLGDTGVRVSELGFGTMSFGGDADKETSAEIYKAVRDTGINYFDTADHYNHGLSETYLGEFSEHERKNLVLSTKFYFPTSDDVNDRGTSRKHLFENIHHSLKRLKTDYIDILFIHRFDENTSLEETLRALDDLIKSGEILYIGASNFATWQVMKAQGISMREGFSRIKCIQPMYSLVKRQAEVELLPMALSEKIGVVSYSPLGAGMLTGKYNKNTTPGNGRLVSNEMYKVRYGNDGMLDTAGKFTDFAEKNGFNPAALAVRWAASHKAVTCPLIGARNIEQLKGSLEALNIDMTEELRAEISVLSPEPASATDRNEEK
ncbi:MAG: aldo/keto reductase [Spirochaetales bacterium]|nr:aldo/keto reductase [Spirochaetales bacterium]